MALCILSSRVCRSVPRRPAALMRSMRQCTSRVSHNQAPFIRNMSSLSWSIFDPATASGKAPVKLHNLVAGNWRSSKSYQSIVDPLNGEKFIEMPNTKQDELTPFIDSLSSCPKTGLHNPFRNVERYLMYGEISARAAHEMDKPEVADHLARCIQRVCPKSYTQAMNEVVVTKRFLHNFSGDQVRFLARGFSVSGDHLGQESRGYRWPFGPVAIVAPFNFPLEIPILQLMGALYMGNKPVIKGASTTSMVLEEFIRLLHHCGMPVEDVDLIHCGGRVMGSLICSPPVRLTQFTGSSGVAEQLCRDTHGKVRVEDAGFDWKILGPDVQNVEYVAWQNDMDAYAASGQKCSAQSIMFMHKNWSSTSLLSTMKSLASRRNLQDLTVASVLSHTTEEMLSHTQACLELPGSKLLWGGKELSNHTIPKVFGAIEPTAVFVPLAEILRTPESFELCTTEIFGPFQVITEFDDSNLSLVLEACERMSHHLTAAVVSNDPYFQQTVLGNTVNGTTYTGARARTTAAPQNHWFGPAGDPRGAGIGTPEAIKLVWSCHREVIHDVGPIPEGWTTPEAS